MTEVAPGVVKKTVQDSAEWRAANEGATVTLRYTATLPDGTPFDEAGEGSEVTVVVDDDALPEGVDLALTKMKQGERAVITITDPKCAPRGRGGGAACMGQSARGGAAQALPCFASPCLTLPCAPGPRCRGHACRPPFVPPAHPSARPVPPPPKRMAFGEAGHSGRLARVPPNAAPITYDVTLVTLKSAKEKWEMSAEEKVGGGGAGAAAGVAPRRGEPTRPSAARAPPRAPPFPTAAPRSRPRPPSPLLTRTPPLPQKTQTPQVEAGLAAKEKGNAAYKAGRLPRAARLYGRVVEVVGEADYDREKEGEPATRAAVGLLFVWGGGAFGGAFAES